MPSHCPFGRPHVAAIASKRPPNASVAEVSTTVFSPNSRSRSRSDTVSGATHSARRSVIHTTSASSRASIRTAASCMFSSAARTVWRSVASPSWPVASAVCVFHSASRRAVRGTPTSGGISSQRPTPSSPSETSASCSIPAASSRSAACSAAPTFFARLAVNVMPVAVSSSVATEVMRPSSSWASSTMTWECSGRIRPSDIASMASSAWLVTTTSTPAARALAASAKHDSPIGHFAAPTHSREVTDTCRQAMSDTPRGRESRSPSSVSPAHSRSSSTWAAVRDRAEGSMRAPVSPMPSSWSSGTSATLFWHR